MEDAFISLKYTLCNHSKLTIPSPENTFVCLQMLLVVASVLFRVSRSGKYLPVSYFSRKLTGHEADYAVTELECLAQHVSHYLVGNRFVIKTDLKALESL